MPAARAYETTPATTTCTIISSLSKSFTRWLSGVAWSSYSRHSAATSAAGERGGVG